MKNISQCVYKCLHGDRERYTQFGGGCINGPFTRGRVGLTLKLDELLWPSMTFDSWGNNF